VGGEKNIIISAGRRFAGIQTDVRKRHRSFLRKSRNPVRDAFRQGRLAAESLGLTGFTLIELLVVIAIIALLMAIILPALNSVKKKAAATVCLSNTKNLALGWYLYMQDNDGRIMSSEDNGVEQNGTYVGWIGVPRNSTGNQLSNTQANPPVTDEDEIRGIERGLLFPYVKEPGTYHCPADNIRKSMYDATTVFVSYGLPMCLYGDLNPSSSGYNLQIKTFGEITSPSTRYVFVESAETRNWNSSHHFVLGAPEYTGTNRWGWWGPMAVNHGDSSVLGFCDGHSEVRKWRDRFTIERVDKLIREGVTLYGIEYPPEGQTLDIDYMASGWAYRYKGTQ
jgi:prepilin-type N-terminal cleavage/methylation domain-containing protein